MIEGSRFPKAERPPPAPRLPAGWGLAAIVAASLALRLAVALPMDIFQDEALYWWGARPAELSFSPQPPGVYLSVLAGTGVFGDTLLGLRAATLLLGTGTVVLVYLLGRELYGPRAGLWAAAFFVFCPLLTGSGAAATPDGLVLFFWLLCAWAVWRAVRSPGPGWWALAGLALVLGLYSKYMMVLAFPAAFVALIASPQGRRGLRTPWPWAAAGAALALFLPVFLGWQASHGWPATRYHLAARHEWAPSAKRAASYVLNHAASYSPVLWAGAIGALVAAARAAWRGEARGALLAGFGLLPIAFFLPPSVGTKNLMVQMHWAAFGYAVGLVALGGVVAGGGRWRRRLGVAALGVGGLATAAILVGIFCPRLPLAFGMRPPGHRLLPWRELAERLVERGLAD